MLFCPKKRIQFLSSHPFRWTFPDPSTQQRPTFRERRVDFRGVTFSSFVGHPKRWWNVPKNPPQIPLSLFKSSLDITVICQVYFVTVDRAELLGMEAVEIWVEPVRYRLYGDTFSKPQVVLTTAGCFFTINSGFITFCLKQLVKQEFMYHFPLVLNGWLWL